MSRRLYRLVLLAATVASPAFARADLIEIKPGDHISIIGNTLAERMQYFGHFETRLHAQFPNHELVVRNLGFSADEVKFRPRSMNLSMSRSTTVSIYSSFFLRRAGVSTPMRTARRAACGCPSKLTRCADQGMSG